GHYRPWLVDLRKDKPHQLDDQLEQLFLEKSMTSAAAFNRLFDETIADLRFDIHGASLPLEVTLNMLQEPEPETRKKAAEALSGTFKANLRVFTLITNTLAKDKDISDRWRKFE
ncbi:oligoendopeptidase F, partial [Mesorhizobium sp. M8A.F.Ca.ET.161.01.1.1]